VSKSHISLQGQAVVLALTFLACSLLLLSLSLSVNKEKKNEMKNKKVLDRQQETTKGN